MNISLAAKLLDQKDQKAVPEGQNQTLVTAAGTLLLHHGVPRF